MQKPGRASLIALVVLAKFHGAAAFPGEAESFGTENREAAGNERRIAKLALGNLALTGAGAEVCAEGDLAAGHMIVTGNLAHLDFFTTLRDAHHLFKMSPVMANPLAG